MLMVNLSIFNNNFNKFYYIKTFAVDLIINLMK